MRTKCGGHSVDVPCTDRQKCSHDMRLILLALALMASTSHIVHALSLPGKRIFRRHATISTDTEVVDNEQVRLSKSPAFRSPLFPSPTHGRRDRSIRQHSIIKQRRRKLFRRKGDFQLNYKDYDDELLNIIESEHKLPTRPRIFRGPWKRKSLSKTLFPTEDLQERGIAEEATSLDQLDMQEDITVSSNDVKVEEDVFEETYLTTSRPSVGLASKIKRKKKPQVVVSNIEELHEAILDRGFELRDVEMNYTTPPSLLSSKKPQTPEMASDADDDSNDGVQELVLMTNELNPNYPDIELENNHEPNADEWQLIGNVLAEDFPIVEHSPKEEATKLFSHEVLNLLHQRYHSQSTPMSRSANDTSILALSIEGGGMRGAVSGGMAAAIACLGLSNAFDSIYGSSAGSIIGSYFVSRQLYLDVYTDVIPAGKDLFVSKTKIIGDIFRNMFYIMKGPLGKKLNANLIERFRNPAGTNDTLAETLPPTRAGGLNTSFVLDSIMCPENGLRPLDLDAFAHNDAIQPLRIVSSSVELDTGKLKSICFGSNEGHFRDQFTSLDKDDSSSDSEYLYPEVESAALDEKTGLRRGFWACLGASMSVPGAAGSPFRMNLPHSETNEPTPHACFDAFCYEPVPFRSAVAEGATHVVALRSRPAGYEPKTKPTLYERAVAPLYFRSNGVNPSVAEFFERGGQQYLYAEDVLLCDAGLTSTEPVPIPPTTPIYAGPETPRAADIDRNNWARAHLLPITVPADVPELAVLSQDRQDILDGIRHGFAAAYDALAPVVGLKTGKSLTGMKVAELVFPDVGDAPPSDSVLETAFPLVGEKLTHSYETAGEKDIVSAGSQSKDTGANESKPHRYKRLRRLLSVRRVFRFRRLRAEKQEKEKSKVEPILPTTDADMLLSYLPGVALGGLPMVAERLHAYLEGNSFMEG